MPEARPNRRAVRLELSWMLALAVLLLSGVLYRNQWARLHAGDGVQMLPHIELTSLPMHIGDWTGRGVPLREDVKRAAKMDNFVSRLYVNSSTRQWVNVYAAFSTRPANMIGHKPDVCYVSAGWILERAEQGGFLAGGKEMPCGLHAFRKSGPYDERLVVLNYYILNGEIYGTEEAFSGVEWRGIGPAGKEIDYVAQIQISSTLENSTRAFAECATELMLDILPDENGLIRNGDHRALTVQR